MKQILEKLNHLYNKIHGMRHEYERKAANGNALRAVNAPYLTGIAEGLDMAETEILSATAQVKNIIPLRNTIDDKIDNVAHQCICHIIHEVCDFCNDKYKEELEMAEGG